MAEKKVAVNEEKEEVVLSGRDAILKAPKRKIFIPQDSINKNKTVWIMVNGVDYYLATGKSIEVPEPIAEAYETSYAATIEAYERINAEQEIK